METTRLDIMRKVVKNIDSNTEFVLATVVQGAEGSPGRSGFKLICYPNGSFEGTVGGGELERLIIKESLNVFKNKQNKLITYELKESEGGIGMLCGGEAKIFLEYFPTNKRAYLFGAGHLCRSILPILNNLEFTTVVIDNRKDYANREKLPLANEIFAVEYKDFLKDFSPNKNDAIIIFTHGHKHDFEIIDTICKRNLQVKYIGMIGSRSKTAYAINKIKEKNYSGNLIDKVFAPIGLNIGKTTTHEIAVAIAAEILAVYNGITEIDFYSRINKKFSVEKIDYQT